MTSRLPLAISLLATTALATPAAAQTILFSTGTLPNGQRPVPGQPIDEPLQVRGGVTQIRTSDGAVISLMGDASVSAKNGQLVVSEGRVTATGDGASFRVGNADVVVRGADGAATMVVGGRAITSARVLSGSVTAGPDARNFSTGQAFTVTAAGAKPVMRSVPAAIAAASVPAGPDIGASGGIDLDTTPFRPVLPGGDPLALFKKLAEIRGGTNGFLFPGVSLATFDVNLASVRAGQPLGGFSAAAAAATTAAYLTALRAGTPVTQATSNAAYQAALLSYIGRAGLPAGTPQTTRALVTSYQALLAAGGTPAGFSAEATATTLAAYARFLAAGGAASAYTAASAALLAAYNETYARLGAGNASPAAVATIETQRAALAALGANANLSADYVARLLAAYFTSLGSATPTTGGLTQAQIAAYYAYLQSVGVPATSDEPTRQALAAYQTFLAGGGTFGQPAQAPLQLAQQLARIVAARRSGQTATFLDLDPNRWEDVVAYFKANGLPEGLTDAERERVQAAVAFYGSTGGRFQTVGFTGPATGSPLAPGATTTLGAGSYVVAGYGPTESGPLTGSATTNVLFNGGLPTGISLATQGATFLRQPTGSTLAEGKAGDGWFIGRFVTTPRITSGFDVALAPAFTGTLPTSGQATYQLLAWTTPQYTDGRAVSAASVSGTVGINLANGAIGYTPNATIVATDPLGTRTYAVAGTSLTTTNADLCPSATSCLFSSRLLLGGSAGQTLVGSWSVNQAVSDQRLLGGAWVFGGTLPTGPVTPPVDMPRTGIGSSTNAAAAIAFAGLGTVNTFGSDATATVDANGRPTSLNAYGAPGTATLAQFIKGDGWVLGRWANGTFISSFTNTIGSSLNQTTRTYPADGGIQFALIGRLSRVPTGGIALYNVVDFTQLSNAQGSSASLSGTALTMALGVAFGSVPKFGFDGRLDAVVNGTPSSISFASSGGSAAPSLTTTERATSQFIAKGSAALTASTGALCASISACRIDASFTAGGGDATRFATAYALASTATGSAMFNGAAILDKSSGTLSFDGSLGAGTGGSIYRSTFAGFDRADIIADASGLQSVAAVNAGGDVTSRYDRNTAANGNTGGVAGVLGWSRWVGGVVNLTTASGVFTNSNITNGAGSPQIWGSPATNIPTAGSASYDMVGNTGVGTDTGQTGTIDAASLRVAFGTQAKVGVEIGYSVAGVSYAMNSIGGIAAPSMTLDSTKGTFGSDIGVAGGSCTATTCYGGINGFLAGNGASHAGLIFQAPTAPGRGAPTASGAIAFALRP